MQDSLTGLGCLRMLAPMPKHTRSDDEGAVLFVRGMPRDLLNRLKAAASLQGKTLAAYIQELCEAHVAELERRGMLPKGK
jgi:hypothetical protein